MLALSGGKLVLSRTVQAQGVNLITPILQETVDNFDVNSDPDLIPFVASLAKQQVLNMGAGKVEKRHVRFVNQVHPVVFFYSCFKNVCLQMARIRGFNASLEKQTGKLREIVEEMMKTIAFRVRFISRTQYWFVTFD